MMSDTSITRYGSGDMNYAGGIRLETDDEDLEGTGSGSGDGSGDKGDVTVVSYIPSSRLTYLLKNFIVSENSTHVFILSKRDLIHIKNRSTGQLNSVFVFQGHNY